MGIGADILSDLIWLHGSHAAARWRRVCELGAQQLSPSFFAEPALIDELFSVWGRTNPFSERYARFRGEPGDHLPEDAPSARLLWLALGLEYRAIDYGGQEDTLALDLNFDRLPEGERNRYDLVTNFGTSEHVCNQANSFCVMHDLTKRGGLMFHVLPSGGMLNHGLVNYTPKFFWKLCQSNEYELLFFDFLPSRAPYPVPENVLEAIRAYNGSTGWAKDYRIDDIAMKVIVRKVHDTDFVLPVDVERDELLTDPGLRQRYPSPASRGARRLLRQFRAWLTGWRP